MSECGIYTIEINNKLYVGSSTNLKHRLKVHKSHLLRNKHHNIYLQRSYNKHKYFKFELLEICTEDILLSQEQYWINMLNTTDNNIGYNMCTVAGTTKGMKYSDETRLKMSNSKKGIKFSDSHRATMCKVFKGRIITQETRDEISKTLTGRKIPREIVDRTSAKLKKEVYQYDKNYTLINKFNSTKEAGKHLNIDNSQIARCARGKAKSAGSFIFKYSLI